MSVVNKQVDLLEKQRPRQARAKRTYESILNAAAELLVEVGVERISTNLIAERAGVTVPALYRYFPNKYAVIHVLAQNLIARQSAAWEEWLQEFLREQAPRQMYSRGYDVLKILYDVIQTEAAGIEIFHALRVLAPLRDLRFEMRRRAAEDLARFMSSGDGPEPDENVEMQARMTIEVTCHIVEMAIEDPDLDPEAVLREGARLLESYWQD